MTSMTNAPSLPSVPQDGAALWQHRAFCGLALPLRAPRGDLWAREAEGTSIAMGAEGAAAAGDALPLPAGRTLRLLLLHVFVAALRAGTPAAEIGPDAAAVAASLGLEATAPRLRELQEQLERLGAARLRVAERRGAPLSVLDARRLGSRGGPSTWRPVLHLSARFFASLQQNAVPLDRRVVTALAGSATALDTYAWLAANLPEIEADRPVLLAWESLQQRFGQGGVAVAGAFRAAFTESLETVRAAWPAAQFTAGPDGVELRHGPAPVEAAAGRDPASPAEAKQDAPDAGMASAVVPPPAPSPGHGSADDEVEVTAAAPSAADEVNPPVPEPAPGERAASESSPASESPARRAEAASERQPLPTWERNGGRIRLAPVLTGLELSVWLRRGGSEEGATIEVTPGGEYNLARRSLLILEPMILQVAGNLQPRELDQVAAWAVANADLIQDYWDGTIASVFDVAGRVRPVPATR